MNVSVIVTTYNRPDALKKVLDGLLHQTRRPDEIIVADDGSGDETAMILKSYLTRKDVNVWHVWQKDKGFRAARARNKAILVAKGNYLVFLDGDCIPERHFIADHVALAKAGFFFQGKRVLVRRKGVDRFDRLIIASSLRLFASVLFSHLSNWHHIFRFPFFPSYRVKKLSGIRSCNMGIFKKDIEAVNGFNHMFVGWGREDTELVIRLYRYGLKRNDNPFRAICYHLWHPENPRDNLEQNDRIMTGVLKTCAYYCKSGLAQLAKSAENKNCGKG